MGGLTRGRPPGRYGRRGPDSSSKGSSSMSSATATLAAAAGPLGTVAGTIGANGLVRLVAALAEVLRLDVADVEEAVAADAEIDEGRLDAGLQVDDHALVDVADVAVLARPLHVEFFQDAVFDDRDPAFFRLRHVDEDFFFHLIAFLFGKTDQQAFDFSPQPRGSPSGTDLDGGARQVDALVLQIGQVQRGQNVARSRSAFGASPKAHLEHVGGQRQRLEVGAEVDDRAAPGRWHGQVGAAQRRPIRSSRPARQPGGTGISYEALRGWALRLPGGRSSTDRNSKPGGACCDSRRDNSSAGSVSANSTSITSSSPSIPTAKAKGNVSRGLG